MRHFNFGDWVRHLDSSGNGLVISVNNEIPVCVVWDDGTIDDHVPAQLIIVARSQIREG